jgi:hypothetical protein
MDHAEAHERLTDLALEPEGLAALERDPSPDAARLRGHLASCDECQAEMDSLRWTDAALRDAFAANHEEPPPTEVRTPSGLRARILAAAAGLPDEGSPNAPAPTAPVRPSVTRWAWLGLAAALIVVVGAGGLLVQRAAELEVARAELAELGDMAATLDRILADPEHVIVALKTADGTPGGAIAWNRTEVVVLATTLARPTEGREYRCWVEEDGERWGVGTMSFGDSTAYWAGTLDEWNASFAPGSRFGVSLVTPAGDGDPLPVLVAEF